VSVPWDVTWTHEAFEGLNRLDNRLTDRVIDTVNRYAETGIGDVRRLRGRGEPEWRLRVGGWRVRFVYSYTDNDIVVKRVLPRGSAYRD
jgi:mRNA-degrading endonuclease RelE of RelBE toxin-antitoxin system